MKPEITISAIAVIVTFSIIIPIAITAYQAHPTPTIPEQRAMQADKWLATFNACLETIPQGPRKAEAIACTALADEQVLGVQ